MCCWNQQRLRTESNDRPTFFLHFQNRKSQMFMLNCSSTNKEKSEILKPRKVSKKWCNLAQFWPYFTWGRLTSTRCHSLNVLEVKKYLKKIEPSIENNITECSWNNPLTWHQLTRRTEMVHDSLLCMMKWMQIQSCVHYTRWNRCQYWLALTCRRGVDVPLTDRDTMLSSWDQTAYTSRLKKNNWMSHRPNISPPWIHCIHYLHARYVQLGWHQTVILVDNSHCQGRYESWLSDNKTVYFAEIAG